MSAESNLRLPLTSALARSKHANAALLELRDDAELTKEVEVMLRRLEERKR